MRQALPLPREIPCILWGELGVVSLNRADHALHIAWGVPAVRVAARVDPKQVADVEHDPAGNRVELQEPAH